MAAITKNHKNGTMAQMIFSAAQDRANTINIQLEYDVNHLGGQPLPKLPKRLHDGHQQERLSKMSTKGSLHHFEFSKISNAIIFNLTSCEFNPIKRVIKVKNSLKFELSTMVTYIRLWVNKLFSYISVKSIILKYHTNNNANTYELKVISG